MSETEQDLETEQSLLARALHAERLSAILVRKLGGAEISAKELVEDPPPMRVQRRTRGGMEYVVYTVEEEKADE